MTKIKTLLVGSLLLWIPQLGTTAEEYEPGVDYKILTDTVKVTESDDSSKPPETISVVEYFSYGCRACKKFEAEIAKWLTTKVKDVEFRREAVVFFESWAALAKAYYVAIELNVLDHVHMPMFDAIHDEKISMVDPKQIEELFLDHTDIESKAFRETYNDLDQTVMNRILEVHETVRLMRIKNTPTIVVDSRYLVNTRTAQSQKRIFGIIDHLLEKVRNERKNTELNAR